MRASGGGGAGTGRHSAVPSHTRARRITGETTAAPQRTRVPSVSSRARTSARRVPAFKPAAHAAVRVHADSGASRFQAPARRCTPSVSFVNGFVDASLS